MRIHVMHQIQLHRQYTVYMLLIIFWNVDHQEMFYTRYNNSIYQSDVVSVYLVVICYQTALLGYSA